MQKRARASRKLEKFGVEGGCLSVCLLPENNSQVILVKVNILEHQRFSMVSALQDTSFISANRYTPLIFNHWAAIAPQTVFSQYGLAL